LFYSITWLTEKVIDQYSIAKVKKPSLVADTTFHIHINNVVIVWGRDSWLLVFCVVTALFILFGQIDSRLIAIHLIDHSEPLRLF
jgi:hypothetical protein